MHAMLSQVLLADWATDLVSGLSPDQKTGILIVAIACGTGIVLGAGGMIYSAFDAVHRRRMEVGLKREMIERGMSAEEIERVIKCGGPLEDATERWIASWAEKKTG